MDYMDYIYLEFIRKEERTQNVNTQARIKPCVAELGIVVGYYKGK